MKGKISDGVVDDKFSEFQIDEKDIKKLFNFTTDSECETYAYEENELLELTNLVNTHSYIIFLFNLFLLLLHI